MFGFTVVEVYVNGQFEMSRRFRSRNLALRIAQTINVNDAGRGRRALVVF